MKTCNCKDWQKNIEQITDMQIYCANHPAAPKWEGKVFDYCPWCGQLLLESVKS